MEGGVKILLDIDRVLRGEGISALRKAAQYPNRYDMSGRTGMRFPACRNPEPSAHPPAYSADPAAKVDAFVKNQKSSVLVIPANAGTQES